MPLPKKSDNKLVIGLLNSFSQGKSGGDVVFAEILKRITGFQKIVITSGLGADFCKKMGLEAKFIITTKEEEFGKIMAIYLIRIIISIIFSLKIFLEGAIYNIISGSDFLPDVVPAFLLKLLRKKSIWIQHLFHIIPKSRVVSSFMQKISFALIKNKADYILVDNYILKAELEGLGFKKDRIIVNYPAVDHDLLSKIPLDTIKYDISFMAQLRRSKGVFEIVSIIEEVARTFPDVKVAIIGKGTEEIINKLNNQIKSSYCSSNIHLLGFMPSKEAYLLIKSSRLFLFPSHEEGFGIAPLEAQALGVPVVAYSLPVFDEIFPKGMIKVKEIGDINEIAKSIILALKNKNKLLTLSKDSLQNSKRFNWDVSANLERSLIKFYD